MGYRFIVLLLFIGPLVSISQDNMSEIDSIKVISYDKTISYIDIQELSTMINIASDYGDIGAIQIIFEDNLDRTELDKIYDIFQAKAIEINGNTNSTINYTDVKSTLLGLVGVSSDVSEKVLAQKVVKLMLTNLDKNNGVFSIEVVTVLSRQGVLEYLLTITNQDIPSFKAIHSLKKCMEIEVGIDNLDYYKKPEFVKFKTELFKLDAIKK